MTEINYNPNDVALGENEGIGFVEPVPESYYPVKISVDKYESSNNKGTPGLALILTILEGPNKGRELTGNDMTLWLTPGGPEAKTEGRFLGKLNHMVNQVTGKRPSTEAIGAMGLSLTNPTDVTAVYKDIWMGFNTLDTGQKLEFMKQYANVDDWQDKKAIAFISCKQVQRQRDGKDVFDEKGQAVLDWRNSIENFFGYDHAKHGYGVWKSTHLPLQEQHAAG